LLCFAAKDNPGALISLWAPVVMVSGLHCGASFCVSGFLLYEPHQPSPKDISLDLLLCWLDVFRCTLWTLRFGMLYTQLYMVVFLDHSVGWER
jgi:hypothetical protein